jgi:hypothetical protein
MNSTTYFLLLKITLFLVELFMFIYMCDVKLLPSDTSGIYPCGGGVEYLHRNPASRKRQRNGTKKGRAIA